MSEDDSEPRPPIFVWESGDLAIYGSVARAESQLEPIDVRNGIYVAYDSAGRHLSIDVVPGTRRYWLFNIRIERVAIRRASSASEQVDALRDILLSFLSDDASEDLKTLELNELQQLAYKRIPIRG